MIMDKVNFIINDEAFVSELKKIESLEKDRIYCRHGMSHLMDVARIAYISSLERGLGIDREIIYAAALLHDIGRGCQYVTGEHHDIAGVRIAKDILSRSSFDEEEQALILEAVAKHRGYDSAQKEDAGIISELIKTADNKSRLCFWCEAYDTCKWESDRKNHYILD